RAAVAVSRGTISTSMRLAMEHATSSAATRNAGAARLTRLQARLTCFVIVTVKASTTYSAVVGKAAPYTFGGTAWQDTLAAAQNQALITSGVARDLPVGAAHATPTPTHST